MLIAAVKHVTEVSLTTNVALISRIAAERKKFEGWLQLEILRLLMHEFPRLEIEKNFPGTQERCDFWIQELDGTQSWIEIKLCVTNYCSQFCKTTSARPITTQITEIERELAKLRRLPTLHRRAVLLIAYPLPEVAQAQPQWLSHLTQLKRSADKISEEFSVRLRHNENAARAVAYELSLTSAEA